MTVLLEDHMWKYMDPKTPYQREAVALWRMNFPPFDRITEAEVLGDAYTPRRPMVAGDIGL